MAALYLDHDVTVRMAAPLRAHGHSVSITRDLGRERDKDDQQLLTAAQNGWILLACNWKDFILLHDAWRHWPRAWHVTPVPEHAGILIVPQPWPAISAAAEIDRFLQSSPPLTNALYRYTPTRGWLRAP